MRRLLLAVLLAAACDKPAPAPTPAPVVDRAEQEERTLALFAVTGDGAVDKDLRARQEAAQRMGKKADAWIALGRAWVEKARVDSDPGWYLHADAAAKAALRLEPDNVAASNLRGLVLLNDHRFAEAKALAEKMLAKDSDDPMSLGTLSDALLEMGDIDGAVAAAQKMMDRKPNLPSYARASWLKWLHGDIEGATESIRLAIDAGRGQKDPEPSAWVLSEAAAIFWHGGDLEGAETGYEMALKALPDLPAALVGKARCALARGDAQAATALLTTAWSRSPSVETASLLADAHGIQGDEAAAQQWIQRAIEHGKKSDKRGLALLLATQNVQLDDARAAIDEERKTRGGPYTDDVHAWVLFRQGRIDEAKAAIERATQYGTPDPRLWFHKGAILMAANDPAGKPLVERALRVNPHFDRASVAEAKALVGGR